VYANAHHAKTAALLAGLTKIPLDVVEHMQRGVLRTQLTPALVQLVSDEAVKYGLLAHSFSARNLIYRQE
jgi:hypothetical protein